MKKMLTPEWLQKVADIASAEDAREDGRPVELPPPVTVDLDWWLHNAHTAAICPLRERCAYCGWSALSMLALCLINSDALSEWCNRRAESIEPTRLHRAWCRWDC